MLLEHPSLEAFEPTLRRIADVAFTGGLNALEQSGLALADIERDASIHQVFIAGCHAGFDRAQAEVVTEIVKLEEQLRKTKRERGGDQKGRAEAARAIELRQLTLRRLIDAILFQVLYPEHRAVRYFAIQNRMQPIDPRVLRKTAEAAAKLNAETPMKFCLLSDLTSIAQIGDLICVDRSNPAAISCAVIELKEGKMNERLLDLLKDRPSPLSDEDVSEIARTINSDAAKQARRIDRQKQRARNFASILARDEGDIPLLNRPVSVDPTRVYVGDYFEALGRLWAETRQRGYAATTVDRCLHIVAIKNEAGKPHGRRGLAAHTAYHMVNEAAECLLPDPERREQELDAVATTDRAMVNVILNSLNDKMGYSPFVIGHSELTMDLLFERIFLYAYFDYAKFFALAAEHGLRLEWVTTRPPSEVTFAQHYIPGSPNAYGVRVSRDGVTQSGMLLAGFFKRAISDFTPPGDLLKALIARQPKSSAGISSETPTNPAEPGGG